MYFGLFHCWLISMTCEFCLSGDTAENCIETGSDADMAVLSASDKAEKKKVFKFDKVFQMGATQEDVYSETQPLIRSVLDGEQESQLCFELTFWSLVVRGNCS